ncbi:glycosyltransferase involved in cell wall biosynthesis [Kordia periserrulae]|uniref:Glycosyltransferase involved in cell wall biosynthesis n=1 Tax=Kordia periserrulae TaxID=701523 RepID=A0A2T6BZJ4_9FLAO|nr:glycosyltransferase family 4 protein [Kordia periserrulae]PTX61492.1 glycosyltransferase involved in cell wall biosynthesis [Kordia periserrulae]
MHIAFLLPEYPHEKLPKSAGIGTSTKNLLKALVDKGLKITVFTYFQDKQEVFQDGKITVHKIKLRKYPALTWKLNEGIINKYINKTIKKEQIDVLEVVDWTGISANMNFPIPQVMRLHGSDTFFCHLEGRNIKQANYNREQKAFQKADTIIAVSQFVAEKTSSLFKTDKEITVIPNGIYIVDFQPDISKQKEGIVLYFGTLIRKKGILELAHIFNELIQKNSHCQLILVGNDAKDATTQRATWELFQEILFAEAKEKVTYLGVVDYNRMKELINEANVCVFPSLAESFGMVTIEAMAMQKPIVNTNYPWATEIVDDGETGFLVDPKSHKEFAEKINLLLTDVELASEMAKKAREVALERFDIANIANQNIQVYQSLIEK